jgi:FtsP/CotA-like multicopper oxidase with cupredoxin domain
MHASEKTRREFVSRLVGSAGLLLPRTSVVSADTGPDGPAEVTLRIAPVKIEVAPGRAISTVGYNGSVPGPLVRFREGVTATVVSVTA